MMNVASTVMRAPRLWADETSACHCCQRISVESGRTKLRRSDRRNDGCVYTHSNSGDDWSSDELAYGGGCDLQNGPDDDDRCACRLQIGRLKGVIVWICSRLTIHVRRLNLDKPNVVKVPTKNPISYRPTTRLC